MLLIQGISFTRMFSGVGQDTTKKEDGLWLFWIGKESALWLCWERIVLE